MVTHRTARSGCMCPLDMATQSEREQRRKSNRKILWDVILDQHPLRQTAMTLTPKERMQRALLHEPIDRIPTQINTTASMGQKLAAHFGVATVDLPRVLDNHFLRVDLTYPERLSGDGKVRFDWWGAGHDTGEEGYSIPVNPLKDSKDLDAFPWPHPTIHTRPRC